VSRPVPPTVGLLGGSFNPAHAGHVHLSQEALKRLGLGEIWWLVSPKNPLKSAADLAGYEERLARARAVAGADARIRVSAIEAEHQWRFTIDTVRGLQRKFPRVRFVWLIGADNLAQFHRWRDWQALARRIPIAVFDRAPFTFAAIRSPFALRYARTRVKSPVNAHFVQKAPPGWAYIHMRRHPLSSTQIRRLSQ
jgi:nicotinate-nucleotide adenylyltransferase